MAEEEGRMAEVQTEVFGNRQRFRIYWFMLSKKEPVGVREIQRGLGISSPSVVSHHLDRLKGAGIVSVDDYGKYTLESKVEVGVMQAFTKVGSFMLPRFAFYAYLFLFGGNANVYATVFGSAGTLFSWYETYRVWSRKPF
ncbi:MAG: winged helix-turn-helix transcriptional regulator [Thaumarchaeota archaeon]|nr:MAG: winged helix-turn-helix transcriptional regulator [Nitrososphaerota archaeon]